jgi:hypothetical protein
MSCCDCCCLAVNGECCGPPGEKACCKEPRVCCGSGEEQVCCPEGQECEDGECVECEPYTCGDPPDLEEQLIYNNGISPSGEGNLTSDDFGELSCIDVDNPNICFDSPCPVSLMEHLLTFVSDCADDPDEDYKITVTVSLVLIGWVGGGDITSPQIASSTRQHRIVDCDGTLTLVPIGSADISGYSDFCEQQNEFLDELLSQDGLEFNPLP